MSSITSIISKDNVNSNLVNCGISNNRIENDSSLQFEPNGNNQMVDNKYRMYNSDSLRNSRISNPEISNFQPNTQYSTSNQNYIGYNDPNVYSGMLFNWENSANEKRAENYICSNVQNQLWASDIGIENAYINNSLMGGVDQGKIKYDSSLLSHFLAQSDITNLNNYTQGKCNILQ
ncbi:hypothetical protein AYI70_g1353 [Smittium culicis]|uniref:Uncharacterized protein n=1 Tax=Smittium culicis TaxID=133412 RepID=A0A1R1YCW7_9FUNG|nr:hypothetical protein AYI70_g9977 [Smittium culicis]OMJ24761.1 hypothetical protein AYI70_g1353 [Smittium culicis]